MDVDALCDACVRRLAAAGFEAPERCPVGDGAVDLNWHARRVYFEVSPECVLVTTVARPKPKPEDVVAYHVDLPPGRAEDALYTAMRHALSRHCQ